MRAAGGADGEMEPLDAEDDGDVLGEALQREYEEAPALSDVPGAEGASLCVCCAIECPRVLGADSLNCVGCFRGYCSIECIIPPPSPAHRERLRCGKCHLALEDAILEKQAAWEKSEAGGGSGVGGDAAQVQAQRAAAEALLAPALHCTRGLPKVLIRLERRGLAESLRLFTFARRHGLSNASHVALIDLLQTHGRDIVEAAERGDLRGPEACRDNIREIGKALGSRGIVKNHLEIKNAVGASEKCYFAAQDLHHLVDMLLRNSAYAGALQMVSPLSGAGVRSAADANTPGDCQVARELTENFFRLWDAKNGDGVHTNRVRRAMEILFPVEEYVHLCHPMLLQLFVDGVACSPGLKVGMVNFMWKVCNFVPGLVRTEHAWLSGGCATSLEMGRKPSPDRQIEVRDAYGKVLKLVALQQLYHENNRPIVVIGSDSNGVFPSLYMGRKVVVYSPLLFLNFCLDGGEIAKAAQTDGCVLGPCLKPLTEDARKAKEEAAGELGDEEVVGGGGLPRHNMEDVTTAYQLLGKARELEKRYPGKQVFVSLRSRITEYLSGMGFSEKCTGLEAVTLPPTESASPFFAFTAGIPSVPNALHCFPPDYNLHVLLTGFCKLLSALVLLAVQRSRGVMADGKKDSLGHAQASIFSDNVARVAGFTDGVHEHRANRGGLAQKEALLPGRKRWALLFALLACASQGALPHQNFRRGVIEAVEALLAILTLTRFRATGPRVTELLGIYCNVFRAAVKAHFGGKSYKGGAGRAAGEAVGDGGEWSFRKFHALLEIGHWVKLFGQTINYSCECAEMLNGKWFKSLFVATNGVNSDANNVPQQMSEVWYDGFMLSSILPNIFGGADTPAPFPCLVPPMDSAVLSGKGVVVRAADVAGLPGAWARLRARCAALRDVALPVDLTRFPTAVLSRAEEVPAGARNYELYCKDARADALSILHFYPGAADARVSLEQPRVPMYQRLLDPAYGKTALLGQPVLFFRLRAGAADVDFVAVDVMGAYAPSARGDDYNLFKPRTLSGGIEVYPLQHVFSTIWGLPWYDDALPPPVKEKASDWEEERTVFPAVVSKPVAGTYLVSTFVR